MASITEEDVLEVNSSVLFQKAALMSFEKQIKLQNFVLTLPDDHEWNVDFGTGKFKLHNQTFDGMLAGSESFISNTWLWGDVQQGLYPGSLQKTKDIRTWGSNRAGTMFIQDQLELAPDFYGLRIAYIFVHLAEASCHWRIDNAGNGTTIVTFQCEEIDDMPGLTAATFHEHWNTLKDMCPMENEYACVKNYAEITGYRLDEPQESQKQKKYVLHFEDGGVVGFTVAKESSEIKLLKI